MKLRVKGKNKGWICWRRNKAKSRSSGGGSGWGKGGIPGGTGGGSQGGPGGIVRLKILRRSFLTMKIMSPLVCPVVPV